MEDREAVRSDDEREAVKKDDDVEAHILSNEDKAAFKGGDEERRLVESGD